MRFLEESLGELAVKVVYCRGETTLEIQAVRAGVSWNTIQRLGGTALESSARDFIILAAQLPFNPKPKDRIIDGEATWTVFNQLSEECFRPMGDSGLIRVHCRRTA